MSRADLCIVLHAHLPYVRHPEVDEHGFENWYYEAVWEVYAPLVEMFDRLHADRVPFRLTVSISSSLLAMCNDKLLGERLHRHLRRLAVLTDKELKRLKGTRFEDVGLYFHQKVRRTLKLLDTYHGNIANGFKKHARLGHIEVITTPATHGFLPHLLSTSECVRAQVKLGAESHKRFFGETPAGMWLSECAYMPAVDGAPGIDAYLAEAGVRWCILETHGVTGATPRPPHGVHAPILTPSGVAVFGREPEASKQVWSADEGYPGDAWYMEHHKDAGWFLDEEQIRPFRPDKTGRVPLGLRYFRVTDKSSGFKKHYVPHVAAKRASSHAHNFLAKRNRQAWHLIKSMGHDTPVVTAPYDAELFGHWWQEGPLFLEHVFRNMRYLKNPGFRFATPSDRMKSKIWHRATPAASSWGDGGYYRVWLNGTNDRMIPPLDQAGAAMVRAARDFARPAPLQKRALNQMARELVLAQSSDWPFIATTTAGIREYAWEKFKRFIDRFWGIEHALRSGTIQSKALQTIEWDDNIFPFVDYRLWRPKDGREAQSAKGEGRDQTENYEKRERREKIERGKIPMVGLKAIEPFKAFCWWELPPAESSGRADIELKLACLSKPQFEKIIPTQSRGGNWYVHRLRPGSVYQFRVYENKKLLTASNKILLPGKARSKKSGRGGERVRG